MALATLRGAERTGTSPAPAPVSAVEDPGAPTTEEWAPTPEELASARTTVARLKAAYPSVDAATVEATVEAAYDAFRQARVRKYVPILAERRSRKALAAATGSNPGHSGGRALTAGGRERGER
ncbi:MULTISPECIES: three-helix bundle dimerization domain-containing protein [unclassified Streptomyces]|uniref:three-helix bundle dimerization domain-containing protein n=1 Tax=unclassified Streptomyces TaxID=2593676 RepID=UPI003668B098